MYDQGISVAGGMTKVYDQGISVAGGMTKCMTRV